MRKVVVTGASGFVGRTLTTSITRAGFTVVPVSRRAAPGVYQVDDYRRTPRGDVVIHLAEEAVRDRANDLGDSYAATAADVVATLASRSAQQLIYLSSGVVYGDEATEPRSVDAPVAAVDTYTKSKLKNERIVLAAGGAVVRLANVFGPDMSPYTVISEILRQLPGEGPVRIRDDAPIRDFVAVRDVASALVLLADREFSGILNVGSGIGTSIGELARILLAAAGQAGRDVVSTQPSHRPSTIVLDTSQTAAAIGWRAEDPRRGLVRLACV